MDYSKVIEQLSARISHEIGPNPPHRNVTVNEIVELLLDVLKQLIQGDFVDVTKQETLDWPVEGLQVDDESSAGRSSSEEEAAASPDPSPTLQSFTLEYMREAVEF